MVWYFAYGSNMNEKQMTDRCQDSKLSDVGMLKGYKLSFTTESVMWGGGVADILNNPESEVWGLLYEISEDDLKNLDKYEGEAYERKKVTITKKSNNEHITAIAYSVINKKSFIKPSFTYLKIILDAANKYNFPSAYIKYLEGISNV